MRITVLSLLILFSKIAVCQESSKVDYHLVEKDYSKEYRGYELNKYHIMNYIFLEKEFLLNLKLKDLRKSNESEKLVLSITDDSYYDNKFLFYENDRTEDTVVLWKLEGEYHSYIYFLHFNIDKMNYLGEVNIGEDCASEGCEVFNISKDKIHVSKQYGFISILFEGKNVFYSKEISPNGSLTSENLTLHFQL